MTSRDITHRERRARAEAYWDDYVVARTALVNYGITVTVADLRGSIPGIAGPDENATLLVMIEMDQAKHRRRQEIEWMSRGYVGFSDCEEGVYFYPKAVIISLVGPTRVFEATRVEILSNGEMYVAASPWEGSLPLDRDSRLLVSGESAAAPAAWTFNGDHRDLSQVAPFLDDFISAMANTEEDLDRDLVYPDDLLGRIAGIKGSEERTALWLLRVLLRETQEAKSRTYAYTCEGFEALAPEVEDSRWHFDAVAVVSQGSRDLLVANAALDVKDGVPTRVSGPSKSHQGYPIPTSASVLVRRGRR